MNTPIDVGGASNPIEKQGEGVFFSAAQSVPSERCDVIKRAGFCEDATARSRSLQAVSERAFETTDGE